MSAAVIDPVADDHENRHGNAAKKSQHDEEIIPPRSPGDEETRIYPGSDNGGSKSAEDDANIFEGRASIRRIHIVRFGPRGDDRGGS